MSKRRPGLTPRDRDDWPTPWPAVLPLLPHLKPGTRFVEPCCGAGDLVQHLERAGHTCVASYDLPIDARIASYAIGTAVAAAKALGDGRQPAPFDEELYECGTEKLARHLDEQRAALNRAINERWAGKRLAYDAYLASETWRNKRAEALRRDEGVCQGCRTRPANQVHHLTYAHLGDELLFELISVCDDCHERIHAAPRTTEGLGA